MTLSDDASPAAACHQVSKWQDAQRYPESCSEIRMSPRLRIAKFYRLEITERSSLTRVTAAESAWLKGGLMPFDMNEFHLCMLRALKIDYPYLNHAHNGYELDDGGEVSPARRSLCAATWQYRTAFLLKS